VLTDIPFSEKWTACKSSFDRLIWLTQQYPRVCKYYISLFSPKGFSSF